MPSRGMPLFVMQRFGACYGGDSVLRQALGWLSAFPGCRLPLRVGSTYSTNKKAAGHRDAGANGSLLPDC